MASRFSLLREYLSKKYNISRAYYFLGYLIEDKEVFKFLDDALRDLQEKNTRHNKEFKLAQIFLNQLKNEILNI